MADPPLLLLVAPEEEVLPEDVLPEDVVPELLVLVGVVVSLEQAAVKTKTPKTPKIARHAVRLRAVI